jgi:hypothetical protein
LKNWKLESDQHAIPYSEYYYNICMKQSTKLIKKDMVASRRCDRRLLLGESRAAAAAQEETRE